MTSDVRAGSAQLFAGVDRAVFAASFADRLHRAGLAVPFTSIERCAASLDAVGPMSVDDAYWTLRLSFVTRRDDLAVFNEVFAAVFDVHLDTSVRNRDAMAQQARLERADHDDDRLVGVQRSPDDQAPMVAALPWATLPSAGADDPDDADSADDEFDDRDDLAVPELRAAADAADMERPFDLLDEAELERVAELLRESVTSWPMRRSRRRQPAPTGRIAIRRTMRAAMRRGGEVVDWQCERAVLRPRPIVALLDVSGSMEAFARINLHVLRPLVAAHEAEVFAFASELHRVTPALRRRSSADAIEHLNDVVGDRFSGTRIAWSIGALLAHPVWSHSVRGAVVLVCSDGWDTDEPEALDRVMRRLALRAHRIVWVNPRAAAEGFEPLAGGMAAARPYCDVFLPGNTGRSMIDVVTALTTDGR